MVKGPCLISGEVSCSRLIRVELGGYARAALHAAQLYFSLQWGQPVHITQAGFRLPWGQG